MSNHRIIKKKRRKAYGRDMGCMPGAMPEEAGMPRDMLRRLEEHIEREEETLSLFYEEYLRLKKRDEKKFLNSLISLRESMIKEARKVLVHSGNEECADYLRSYVDEIGSMLEEYDVEIIRCTDLADYDSAFQEPLVRENVSAAELHNKILKVYGDGYRWQDCLLKKAAVSVGIYVK